jgi:O-antigen/teichoic acid export membrane protein
MKSLGHFRNASWGGVSAAIRSVVVMLTSLLALRLLGAPQFGQVATWLSLYILYLSLNSNAFTMLVVRLMALSDADSLHDRPNAIATAVAFCLLSLILLFVITIFLGAFLIHQPKFVEALPPRFDEVILLMGTLTGIQTIVALQAAVIEGKGRLDLATKAQLIGPMFVFAVLLMVFIFGAAIEARHYVAVLCIGALVDLFLLWSVRRRLLLPLLTEAPTLRSMRGILQMLRSGGMLQAASLLNLFLEPTNKFLLNNYSGPSTVAIYDLAMKVIWGIQYLMGSAMRVFLHIGSQDRVAVGRSFSRAICLLGVPVVAMHVVGILFLYFASHYWVELDTVPLIIFFGIASISNLGMIYVTPFYLSLIGRRELNFIFMTHALLAIVNASLSVALIPHFGLVGSAFGLLVATVINGSALYLRCDVERKSAADESFATRKAFRRIALTSGLLVVTVGWSLFGEGGVLGLFGIVASLALIIRKEPIVQKVSAFFLPKRQQP